MRIRLTPDRHLLDHLNAITFESDYLFRIIRQETELAYSEIIKDLRADSVIAQVAGKTEFGVCFDRIESLLLQLVGMNLCRESDAAALLPHVDQHSAGFADLPQRRV